MKSHLTFLLACAYLFAILASHAYLPQSAIPDSNSNPTIFEVFDSNSNAVDPISGRQIDFDIVTQLRNDALHHEHDHDGLQQGKRTCDADTKTQILLDNVDTYKTAHERQQEISDQYVQLMRENKANSKDRRGLYSTYDDEIDNEPVILIPVVYHVLYSNEIENLSDNQLQSQINVFNKDFRATNSEILTGQVPNMWSDRVGDSKLEYYINNTLRINITNSTYSCANEATIKLSNYGGSDAWDPRYYLNIWTCDISQFGLLGYAYEPCLLDTGYEWLDGLVLSPDAVGSSEDDDGSFYFAYPGIYDEGRTATHEIGHWLNLDHIWGLNETCQASDGISDTPVQRTANYGCPDNSTNSCVAIDPETGRDLRDMYENYMDYTNDACMFIFSEEQVWRMRSVVSGTGCRKELYYQGAQLAQGQTYQPSSQRTTGTSFTCNDGCPIPEEFLDDGNCDCSQCEDEQYFTCATCVQGCPKLCTDYTFCGSYEPSNEPSSVNVASDMPSGMPSNIPSSVPSMVPSKFPSDIPSIDSTSLGTSRAPTGVTTALGGGDGVNSTGGPDINVSSVATNCYNIWSSVHVVLVAFVAVFGVV